MTIYGCVFVPMKAHLVRDSLHGFCVVTNGCVVMLSEVVCVLRYIDA